MPVLIMILLFLLLTAGSLTAFACFAKSMPQTESKLVPFVLLPVPDGSPSTRAFLELYASQVAWMDSSVLQCVFLIWEHPEARELCEDMRRQHDFFVSVSLTEAHEILREKTCKTCCNFEKNTV